MRKILFLDIDGVLNVMPVNFDKYGAIFKPQFVNNLKWIIEETDAEIVLSSSWRQSGLDVMNQMWKHRNLPKYITDITPTLNDFDFTSRFFHFDQISRGDEIEYWLNNNQWDKFCIIDDHLIELKKPRLVYYFPSTNLLQMHPLLSNL